MGEPFLLQGDVSDSNQAKGCYYEKSELIIMRAHGEKTI
jgi:hypothetical protein